MKVLQTLGRHGGAQEGILQYKRTQDGVVIDSGVGRATLSPQVAVLLPDEWQAILAELSKGTTRTFRLTGTKLGKKPPKVPLYALLSRAVPEPSEGWRWNDSWRAYVCAILEHEGSIDLYHGPLG